MNSVQQQGVPLYEAYEFFTRMQDYVVLIPVINEGQRLIHELERAQQVPVRKYADIVICDGDSSDGSTEHKLLRSLDVNTLLVKKSEGRQGAQLRMGIHWAMQRGYKGVITIDGNDKDSIEDVPLFIQRLNEGYDFVQGSRFIRGGRAVNTPISRYLAVRFIHAPVISLTARKWFTDTTNAFRAYSMRYLKDDRVLPLRDVFCGYELLAYLSVRATQLHYRACEVPVSRIYPKSGKVPTKISPLKGNMNLLAVLFNNLLGAYNPRR